YRGEVLALYGLVGSGRTEVALALFGDMPPEEGEILLDGRPVRPRRSREAIDLAISYVPEDRRTQGLFLPRSVSDNLTSAVLGQLTAALGLIVSRREAELVARQMDALSIKSDGPSAPVASLSGGNQQKVLLGRWLIERPT